MCDKKYFEKIALIKKFIANLVSLFFYCLENTVYEVKENIGNAAMAEPKQMIEAMEDKVDGKKESSVVAKPPTIEFKERDDRVSNLQLENRLLKGEITSLNEELANSMRRLKEAEEGLSFGLTFSTKN